MDQKTEQKHSAGVFLDLCENEKPDNPETGETVSEPLPKIIAVSGSTGTGKSALAVRLAKELDGEVISCDSMQVYRKMDIGTAKITEEEMDGIRHHLIDIQDYEEPYHVQIFQKKCREAVEDILSRHKVPILCGGTGLYMKSVLYDYEFRPEESDPKTVSMLEGKTNEELVSLLKEKDPQALEKIHINNRKRLLRAALLALSDKNKSQRENEQNHKLLYDVYLIGLSADKKIVDERIDLRVEKMFEQGLVSEVESLFENPKTWSYTSFQGIGYKEFRDYFEGKSSLDQVKEAIKIHTRQYAKRQMTWFRNQMQVHWYDLNHQDEIVSDVKDWYQNE